jgi:hypothetical protein
MPDRPPRFTRAAVAAAAHRVLTRRTENRGPDGRRRDPDPDLVRAPALSPTPTLTELLELVLFVGRYQKVHPEILREDARAQLIIIDYLQCELERRKLNAIRLARAPDWRREDRENGRRSRPNGLTWPALAPVLRVGSGQGAEQTFLRLVAAYDGPDESGPKDERVARAERRRVRTEERSRDGRSPVVRAFVALVLGHADSLPGHVIADLCPFEDELDPRQSTAVSSALVDQTRTLVRQLLVLGVGGRLREAIDPVAESLGMDLGRELQMVEAGLLDWLLVGDDEDEDGDVDEEDRGA